MGWDEAFLGVVAEDPEALARRIQARVRAASGLDCSVGIGQNKLQAKLATDFGKPAGVFRLTSDTWYAVLGDRPTNALWGIGGKTAGKLAALGIGTVAELAATDPERLVRPFGPATGPWLVRLARGEDHSPVVGDPYEPRSRSREVTFQQDIDDWERVREEVARLARHLGDDATADQRPVARVVVKVRYVPFTTQTHGHALPAPTADADALEAAALAALERFTVRRPVRLLGVRTEFAVGQ